MTPVTPSTLYVEEPSTPYESSTRNMEEPVTTPIMASTPPVGNPDDSHVIPRTPYVEEPVTPRHPDPRVKLGYLGICDKPEEVKPPVVYGRYILLEEVKIRFSFVDQG